MNRDLIEQRAAGPDAPQRCGPTEPHANWTALSAWPAAAAVARAEFLWTEVLPIGDIL